MLEHSVTNATLRLVQSLYSVMTGTQLVRRRAVTRDEYIDACKELHLQPRW